MSNLFWYFSHSHPCYIASVTKRPLHMFCWKLSDWGEELFSCFSHNSNGKLLSCNCAGKRASEMNNWWCEMDGFPSEKLVQVCVVLPGMWGPLHIFCNYTISFFSPPSALHLHLFSFGVFSPLLLQELYRSSQKSTPAVLKRFNHHCSLS